MDWPRIEKTNRSLVWIDRIRALVGENHVTTTYFKFKYQLKKMKKPPTKTGQSQLASNLQCAKGQAKSPKSKPCASWGKIGTTSTTNASAATLMSPAESQPRRFSVSEICLGIFLWCFAGGGNKTFHETNRELAPKDQGLFQMNFPFGANC